MEDDIELLGPQKLYLPLTASIKTRRELHAGLLREVELQRLEALTASGDAPADEEQEPPSARDPSLTYGTTPFETMGAILDRAK